MSLEELPVLGGKSTGDPLSQPPTAHEMPKGPLLFDLLHPKDMLTPSTLPVFYFINKVGYVYFIVAPCILTTLMFLSPTNALLYYTYKLLKYTVKTSHYCSYMFRSIWTIIRELMPNLARVTMFFKDASLNVQQCW